MDQNSGAPAGNPTPTPAPVTPPPAAAAPAAPTGGDWVSGLPELTRGYVQNKGWQKPEDLITSYQNAEKMLNAPADQLMRMPKEDDAEAWGKLWGRLGRPEKADGYGLKGKDGTTSDFQKWAQETFHGAGLNAKQAQALAGKWDEYMGQQEKANTNAFNQKIEQEVSGLKSEWGMAHDQYVKQAKQAAEAFGVSEKTIQALEKEVGYSETMKFFQKIGSKLGESSFVSGDRTDSFNSPLTREMALSKIAELKQDSEFVSKWASGDAKLKAELDRLHKFAHTEA